MISASDSARSSRARDRIRSSIWRAKASSRAASLHPSALRFWTCTRTDTESDRSSRPIMKMVNLIRSSGRLGTEYHSVTIVPPKVSTSESGRSAAISSAARQAMALTGSDESGSLLLPRSLSLIPPALPVKREMFYSSLTGVAGLMDEHPTRTTSSEMRRYRTANLQKKKGRKTGPSQIQHFFLIRK